MAANPTLPSAPYVSEVRRAGPVDVPDLVGVLAAAFEDDPVFAWLMPRRGRRRVLSPAFFQIVLEATVPHREVYATGADPMAAAVWVPPSAEIGDDEFSRAVIDAAEEAGERFAIALAMLAEVHPRDPHAYLFLLGARPQLQSRGYGSALLRHVLDRCDRDGTPAYLEATSERNHALYLRHGFVETGLVRLPQGPPIWPMWREARP